MKFRPSGALRCAGALLAVAAACQSAAAPPSTRPGAAPARATPPPAWPGGDAEAGREKAEAGRCFECHGNDGLGVDHGNATGVFARLAGQSPAYLVKQLRDFTSGARKHDVMRVMARHLDDSDQRDIAAYFATRPPMHDANAASTSPASTSASASSIGAALFETGAPARGVPACSTCHGAQGRGTGRKDAASIATPSLAGQDARYLDRQLRDWRSGWRQNSVDGAMSRAARALTDADIEQIVKYLSGAVTTPASSVAATMAASVEKPPAAASTPPVLAAP